jgi:hypothetical protein
MLFQVYTENGVKKIKYLTADTGTGAPVGTIIEMPENRCPQGYLPMGEQFDETVYPALYQYLGTNTTPYKRSSVTRANPVQLSWTALNTAYYAPDDGEVIISTGTQRIDIYINDERVGMTTIGQVSAFEVKKGDKFLFDDASTGGSIYMVWFIQNMGYCFIKATSGLTENQQENVLNTINDNLSYSTTEHKTGKKYNGKDVYSKTIYVNNMADFPISTGIINVDEVLKMTTTGKDLSNYYNIPYYTVSVGTLYYCAVYFHPDDGTLRYEGNVQTQKVICTLEYTKTTD